MANQKKGFKEERTKTSLKFEDCSPWTVKTDTGSCGDQTAKWGTFPSANWDN